MKLVQGPVEHRGFKSLDEWAQMASGTIQVLARDDVDVPIILRPGEGVVKVGRAALYEQRTRRVSSGGGSYVGFSFRVAKGVRLHTGSMLPKVSSTVTENRAVDEGELILTNQRLVFNGNKKPANMELSKVFAVDVEEGLLEVGYGSKTHRFLLLGESPLKWETYIRGVIQLTCRQQEVPHTHQLGSVPRDQANARTWLNERRKRNDQRRAITGQDGPGFYQGKHYTEWVNDIRRLEQEGRLDEAAELLIKLVDAVEAEAKAEQWGVAPWYYERLAIIYRKQKRYTDEVAILERFAGQRHAPGAMPPKLLKRLERARALAAKVK